MRGRWTSAERADLCILCVGSTGQGRLTYWALDAAVIRKVKVLESGNTVLLKCVASGKVVDKDVVDRAQDLRPEGILALLLIAEWAWVYSV